MIRQTSVSLLACLVFCIPASAQQFCVESLHPVIALAEGIPDAVKQAYQSVGRITKSQPDGVMQHGSATYLGDGLWITNRHVVLSSQRGQFTITTKDGRELPAKVVAVEDGGPDLALVETANQDAYLRPVPLSESETKIGDLVYPSGFDQGNMKWHTIWAARVTERYATGSVDSVGLGPRKGAISGNSGGPTFNSKGELIAPLNANGGAHYSERFGPRDGLGTTITVSWSGTRYFLLPWRRRVMESLAQYGRCNPGQGCPPMSPIQGGSVPRPTLPQYPQPQQQTPPPSFQPSTQPQQQSPLDYEKLADEVITRMAKDDRFKGPRGEQGARGPQGPSGAPGPAGTVSEKQLLALSSAIMQHLKADPTFRGPPGPAGRDAEVDVGALANKIKADLSRRFIVVNSATGNVIDDETYAIDEPVVLDLTRLQRAVTGQ